MKRLTVNDLRRLINDLPGNAEIYISPFVRAKQGPDSGWGDNDREVVRAMSVMDARFGPVLVLQLGGYCPAFPNWSSLCATRWPNATINKVGGELEWQGGTNKGDRT